MLYHPIYIGKNFLGRRKSATIKSGIYHVLLVGVFDWIKASIMARFDGEHNGGGASRSLAAVGGVQGFFSEYSLFLIVLFAAIIVVFLSIILALAVYICKAGSASASLVLPQHVFCFIAFSQEIQSSSNSISWLMK